MKRINLPFKTIKFIDTNVGTNVTLSYQEIEAVLENSDGSFNIINTDYIIFQASSIECTFCTEREIYLIIRIRLQKIIDDCHLSLTSDRSGLFHKLATNISRETVNLISAWEDSRKK